MRFQPVVEVESELSFGIGRHSVTELIEPRLGLVQPARAPWFPPTALMGKGQPDPVDHGTTRLRVGLEALLEEGHRFLISAVPVCQGPLLGQ